MSSDDTYKDEVAHNTYIDMDNVINSPLHQDEQTYNDIEGDIDFNDTLMGYQYIDMSEVIKPSLKDWEEQYGTSIENSNPDDQIFFNRQFYEEYWA